MTHRCGFVAVVGRPNVGKSTLVNRLVGQKVTITSRKAQTTRHAVLGIVSREDAQFVFVDTPGYQTRHGGALNRALNRAVTDSLSDVDVILLVLEGTRFGDEDRKVLRLVPPQVPVVVALNKIDLIARKEDLLPFLAQLQHEREFAAMVPVSAEKGTQCDSLLDALALCLPEGPALYDVDQVTDRSERFLAGEILREKIFRLTGDELPYGTGVVVTSFETEGQLRRIECVVVVARETHKGMVIGQGGQQLKRIATEARMDMERQFGGRVYLDVRVRVDADWSHDPRRLRKYGYA
ncbi:MAG: GTPase Era [Betaproteobacteria bacterium]|nr:GTPase Era [Betaproteobacteria bacterium]